MLQLILGYSGSGKTEYLKEKLIDLTEKGQVFFVVPEQFSFETEKALFDVLGPTKYHKVEVLSFSRLADMVFRQYGGIAGNYMSDTIRLAKLFLATKSVADSLTYYRNQVGKEQFCKKLLETLKELKNLGVTHCEFAALAQLTGDKELIEKTGELSLIFQAYESFIQEGYTDPLDNLTNCLTKLKEHNFFKDTTVILDQFTGFHGTEFSIIEEMCKGAKEVLCTLPVEDIFSLSPKAEFATVAKIGRQLFQLAKKAGVAFGTPVVLEENKRAKPESLKALGYFLTGKKNTTTTINDGAISVIQGKNKYDTAQFVAAKINRLVKEEGYRYRDIAVLTRDLEQYLSPVKKSFDLYKIPLFVDRSEKAQNKPIVSFIENLLAVLVKGFEREDVLSLLKSGFFSLKEEDLLQLERYAFVWNLNRQGFFKEFCNHPEGFGKEFTEEDRALLERLNRVREKIFTPLQTLKKQLTRQKGKEIVKALYRFCEQLKIEEKVKLQQAQIERLGFFTTAELTKQMWDTVVDIFEQLYSGFSEEICSLEEFSRLFHLICENFELGEIPQTADQTVFSQIDRAVLNNPKVTIVLGANLEAFPEVVKDTSLLGAQERQLLKEKGLPLLQDREEQFLDELYYVYKALSSPSEKLIVTGENKTIGGEQQLPSKMVRDLLYVFSNLQIQYTWDFPPVFFIGDTDSAFHILCQEFRAKNSFSKSLEEVFLERVDSEALIHLLEEIYRHKPYRLENQGTIADAYSGDIAFSPTRLEQFQKCRFAYFLQNTLNVKPLEKAQVNYREIGTFVHLISYKVVSHLGSMFPAATEVALKERINQFAETYFADYFHFDTLTEIDKYLLEKMKANTLIFLIQVQNELNLGEFQISDLELEIGKGKEVEPLIVRHKGKEIFVRGIVDRVDKLDLTNRSFIRVIDYKTGSKKFDFSSLYYGLDMQMLLYLLALSHTQKGKYKSASPAAALYMPAVSGTLTGDGDSENLEGEEQKQFKMSGLVLEEAEVLQGLNPQNPYMEYRAFKSGDIKGDSLIKGEELSLIEAHIQETLKEVVDKLLEGDIQALPLEKDTTSPCDFCPYRSVCKIEPTDPVREQKSLRKQEVLNVLKEGQ